MKLFTICCDIGKHSKNHLLMILNILIKSLKIHLENFELVVFTNFYIPIHHPNIKFKKYIEFDIPFNYNSKWLTLSFNKLFLYNHLYSKTNLNYIWIDMDSLIVSDIEISRITREYIYM